MKRKLSIGAMLVGFVVAFGIGSSVFQRKAAVEAAAVQAPRIEEDTMWPKPLPNHWV